MQVCKEDETPRPTPSKKRNIRSAGGRIRLLTSSESDHAFHRQQQIHSWTRKTHLLRMPQEIKQAPNESSCLRIRLRDNKWTSFRIGFSETCKERDEQWTKRNKDCGLSVLFSCVERTERPRSGHWDTETPAWIIRSAFSKRMRGWGWCATSVGGLRFYVGKNKKEVRRAELFFAVPLSFLSHPPRDLFSAL